VRSRQCKASRTSKNLPNRILCWIGNIWATKQKNDSSLRGCSHENANDVSVVPDFTPALSIYGVPSNAGRTLAWRTKQPRSNPAVPKQTNPAPRQFNVGDSVKVSLPLGIWESGRQQAQRNVANRTPTTESATVLIPNCPVDVITRSASRRAE
jgi:hypothetical protein